MAFDAWSGRGLPKAIDQRRVLTLLPQRLRGRAVPVPRLRCLTPIGPRVSAGAQVCSRGCVCAGSLPRLAEAASDVVHRPRERVVGRHLHEDVEVTGHQAVIEQPKAVDAARVAHEGEEALEERGVVELELAAVAWW